MEPARRWQHVKALLLAALEKAPHERGPFLAEVTAADASLRAEVEQLLAEYERGDSFLEKPPASLLDAALWPDDRTCTVLRRIDHPVGDARFAAGHIFASRFRIVSFLGRGGTGEVYRADDLRVEQPVALKLLTRRSANRDAFLRRVVTEVRLAREIAHPNVCRVHDLGHAAGWDYLSMEYVDGETLASLLRRIGRLPIEKAFDVARQLCAGVAAAHERGVLHRDLKPSNVMVDGRGRIRIMDFGLAVPVDEDATPEMAGTPAYMAPEQLAGNRVTERTDLYALGLVLCELFTGRVIFPVSRFEQRVGAGDAAALARATPPVAGTDPATYAIICQCLEADPAKRPSSATAVAAVLEGGSHGSATTATSESPSSNLRAATLLTHRWRFSLAGTFVVIVAALIILAATGRDGWRQRLLQTASAGNKSAGFASVPFHARRSLAVLGFKNLSAQPAAAWLSTALAEMMTTELAAGEQLRLISGEDVARMKAELSLSGVDALASDTLGRVRTNLGADFVVLGTYLELGKEADGLIRLDLRLQDTVAGETIAAVAETGTEANLFDLVSRSGAELRKKLGLGVVPAADISGVRAALPSNTEAARLYAEGLSKLRLFDARAARDLLQKAVAADPDNALVRSALAGAWSTMGYDRQATEQAKRSLELAASLNREERLSVEGRYHEIAREWDKAVAIYAELFRSFPDNVDYGLRLAAAQLWTSNRKNALVTVEKLRELPPSLSDDPRIDLTEAEVASALADHRREKEAAEKARDKGVARGASLLVARALWDQGSALQFLGDPSGAAAAYSEANRLFVATGDQRGVGRTLNALAGTLRAQGELDKARLAYAQALSIYRNLGNQRGAAVIASNLAIVLKDQGRLAAAKQLYQESLADLEKLGDREATVRPLINVAGVLRYLGDLRAAKSAYEEAAAICREFGSRQPLAVAMDGVSGVLTLRGDLRLAKRLREESLATFRELGDKGFTAAMLVGLGEILTAEGDLVQARRKHEEALALLEGMGRKANVAESRLALAALELEEGRPAQGEALATESVTQFRAEKMVNAEAAAQAILARCLLAQGKRPSARRAIGRANALMRGNENREARLDIAITSARVQAASGEVAEAKKLLSASIDRAKKFGFAGYELEGRLALDEIDMTSGNPDAARLDLAALETEARRKGFGLIARKAAKGAGARDHP